MFQPFQAFNPQPAKDLECAEVAEAPAAVEVVHQSVLWLGIGRMDRSFNREEYGGV